MKRNRIVINLDQASPGATGQRSRRGGGAGRVLLIIAAVLLLLLGGIVGGGYFWWRHYQNSPAYTLALLADASQRNDTTAVDKILDTDRVCDDFVSQVRQHASGSVTSAIGSGISPRPWNVMGTAICACSSYRRIPSARRCTAAACSCTRRCAKW